jgi:hypothetical protein
VSEPTDTTSAVLRDLAVDLRAAGLTVEVQETQGVLDLRASLDRPGCKTIEVITDVDGYTEIRFWHEPGAPAAKMAATITSALTAVVKGIRSGVLYRARRRDRSSAACVTTSRSAQLDNDARWREANQLSAEYRAWTVFWLAPEQCFRAYARHPGARRGTALSASTSTEMSCLIRQAEQAAISPPAGED